MNLKLNVSLLKAVLVSFVYFYSILSTAIINNQTIVATGPGMDSGGGGYMGDSADRQVNATHFYRVLACQSQDMCDAKVIGMNNTRVMENSVGQQFLFAECQPKHDGTSDCESIGALELENNPIILACIPDKAGRVNCDQPNMPGLAPEKPLIFTCKDSEGNQMCDRSPAG